jgi:hypothetical protein
LGQPVFCDRRTRFVTTRFLITGEKLEFRGGGNGFLSLPSRNFGSPIDCTRSGKRHLFLIVIVLHTGTLCLRILGDNSFPRPEGDHVWVLTTRPSQPQVQFLWSAGSALQVSRVSSQVCKIHEDDNACHNLVRLESSLHYSFVYLIVFELSRSSLPSSIEALQVPVLSCPSLNSPKFRIEITPLLQNRSASDPLLMYRLPLLPSIHSERARRGASMEVAIRVPT